MHCYISPPQQLQIYLSCSTPAFGCGIFPSLWKSASIVMLLNPHKTPTFPGSYRPISKFELLPEVSKRFDKLLLAQISPVIDRGFHPSRRVRVPPRAIDYSLTSLGSQPTVRRHKPLSVHRSSPAGYEQGLRYYSDTKNAFSAVVLSDRTAGVHQGSILGPVLYLCTRTTCQSIVESRCRFFSCSR